MGSSMMMRPLNIMRSSAAQPQMIIKTDMPIHFFISKSYHAKTRQVGGFLSKQILRNYQAKWANALLASAMR
jgi:hypothetical protein